MNLFLIVDIILIINMMLNKTYTIIEVTVVYGLHKFHMVTRKLKQVYVTNISHNNLFNPNVCHFKPKYISL